MMLDNCRKRARVGGLDHRIGTELLMPGPSNRRELFDYPNFNYRVLYCEAERREAPSRFMIYVVTYFTIMATIVLVS